MKRFLFGFLAVLFLILNTIPYLHILADDMPTNSQYEMLGAYALSTLITSGEATELDFSDYTENDTSFLIDLGEAIFTGDWSGLAEDGLEWLGDTADNIYDSYKEYVSQWKSDHLGIMYSNWFPDETIYVGPDDSYSLAKPLRMLLTPRDNNIIPQPDPDYDWFTQNVNNLYIKGYQTSPPIYGLVYDLIFFYIHNDEYPLTPVKPLTKYSFVFNNGINYHNASSNTSNWFEGNMSSSIININIDTLNYEDVRCTYNSINYASLYSIFTASNGYYGKGDYKFLSMSYTPNYMGGSSGLNSFNYNDLLFVQGSFDSLNQALNYIYSHYANINLYVDNVLWVSSLSNDEVYPIVIPGQLTIYNNQPLEYSFPTDTHIDLPDLTNIIRNAINTSGVVMWSDIADTYVDVNGQTAVAVTKIVRNDYDNLYMEQYPYPAMLVGMTDQTKFNEHLLDNSHAYLSPMGTVVQETVNVLPSELVGVLAIGAILTIFAVIINRLLE